MESRVTPEEMKKRARQFSKDFKDVTKEQAEAQTFWNEFFNVFGQDRKKHAEFEKEITKSDGDGGRIDVFWPGELIIEHKSKGKNLDKAKKQAEDYLTGIEEHRRPKRLIVSDFENIRIYEYEKWGEYEEIKTSDLVRNLHKFHFLSGYKPTDFSENDGGLATIKAAKHVAKFVDEISKSGDYPELGLYVARLIFLMYCEDTTILRKGAISQLLHNKTKKDGSNLGEVINKIFRVVNIEESGRSKNLEEDYSELNYINGPLFSKTIPAIDYDEKMRISLIKLFNLDWADVSPALFGSLIQQVMDEEKRANLGSHYTTSTNILKVINDLFLKDLKKEFKAIKGDSVNSVKKLISFQEKLGKINLLDPACGCGNFLVVAYRELRLLEFEVLKRLASIEKDSTHKGTKQLRLQDVSKSTKVKPSSLHGIELDEFSVDVCHLSILIMDAQLNNTMSDYFAGDPIENVPIKEIANIKQGNALQIDWNDVIDKKNLTYIIGNPPYMGKKKQKKLEYPKKDMELVFGRKTGLLDYVAAWFQKAVEFIQGTSIRIGYVSTNSICQGGQVTELWEKLFSENKIHINFAHQTFEWTNDAPKKAAIHVVIIGLWCEELKEKHLYKYPNISGDGKIHVVPFINPYLDTFSYQFIKARKKPICDVQPMVYGSKPVDDKGRGLRLTPNEKDELINENPKLEKYVKRYVGSKEYIDNIERYCLWVPDDNYPRKEFRKSKFIASRIDIVQKLRETSDKKATKELARYPLRFGEIRQPTNNYLIIPRHSSGEREYIPIGYLTSDDIVGDSAFCVPEASEYTFGLFNSKMHMIWMKYTCGRIKSDYRYSNTIVYNNFPWPEKPSPKNVAGVESAVRDLLKIREKLEKKNSPSDIYTHNHVPKELFDAHEKVSKAVDKCYRAKGFKDETERIEYLFEKYSELSKK